MKLGLLPILGIGAVALMALKQRTKKAINQLQVQIDGIQLGLPPKIRINLINPTALQIEVTYVRIQVKYKGVEIAKLSNLETRRINPGKNQITLDLMPSISAIALLTKPSGEKRSIGISYQVGTRLYEVTGEKETTI